MTRPPVRRGEREARVEFRTQSRGRGLTHRGTVSKARRRAQRRRCGADLATPAALKALSESQLTSGLGSTCRCPGVRGEQVSVASGVSQPIGQRRDRDCLTQQQLSSSRLRFRSGRCFNRFNAAAAYRGLSLADFHVSGTFPARDPTSFRASAIPARAVRASRCRNRTARLVSGQWWRFPHLALFPE